LLSSVARAEGINDLGFRIAGQLGIESLGLYGRLIAQSLTIHESIQTSLALISSYNSGLRIWIERHDDQVRYCQKYVESLPQDRITEVVHLGLADAMANARYGCGGDWQPNRIELASDPIDLTAHFSGLADVPVSFNQPHTSVWADQAVLSAPLRAFDASECPPADEKDLASLLESAPATDPVAQLEQAIESVLGRPDMSLRLTAAIIGTSARTLQRRLAERGSSFSRLLQGIRFRNAQRLLQDPQMPLTEIARRLGYTDSANLIRAFKRWTGVGPSEFRRLQSERGRK
jgi:AraC-like DNA-binding protein